MIALLPGVEQAIIVDLDGVIFDHRGRDHLMPAPQYRHNNEHWLEHQSADNVAKDPILWRNVELVQGVIRSMWMSNRRTSTIALTSRLETNRDATISKLNTGNYGILHITETFYYVDRPMDDHRPPEVFKAAKIMELIAVNPMLKRIVFIEDTQANIDAVMHHCSGLRGVLIQPILMRPY